MIANFAQNPEVLDGYAATTPGADDYPLLIITSETFAQGMEALVAFYKNRGLKARIMTLWNSVLNFISGESFFRPILGVAQTEYLDVVKETLKFLLIPAFTGGSSDGGAGTC